MPMDWEEWQKSRQKNRGFGPGMPNMPDMGHMGEALKKIKLPRGGRALMALPLLLLALWLATGFFTVEPAEVALVKRFGQYARTVDPGLNYHAPFPIEDIIKVNVNRTNRVDIGGEGGRAADGSREENMMLTQDENIVEVRFVVQYRIRDPFKFAFNVYAPQKAVVDAATSAMREVIGRNTIDDALTEKRLPIQEDTIRTLQAMLDKYEIGILVQNVELQDVHVPQDVRQAFREVTSAKEDSSRSINEATGYANKVLPEAEGQAFAIEAQANAYKAQRVNLAKGRAARFTALLAEYKKAPEITRRRLMLENLDSVLPGVDSVIVTGEAGRGLLPHMALNPRPKAAPAAPAAGEKGGEQ